jgi:tetratricopeptide (TPR) repeat protein
MSSPSETVARIFQQAFALHRAGRLAEAEILYRRVLALDPRHADSLNYLGVAAAQSGRAEAAVELIARAVKLKPDAADYHDNLGLALAALGRFDEAAERHRKALRLNPNHANAHSHYGNTLIRRGRNDDAAAQYRAALRIDPNHVEAHNNLGVVLTAAERPDEAAIHFRTALRLQPAYLDAYANLGGALRNLGQVEEADAVFETGLRLAPASPALRYNLAGIRLLAGRFETGWPLYEARHALPGAPPPRFTAPPWRGEALAGRTLLLYAEQGAGDTILACRYISRFAPGTRLLLEVPAALRCLLSRVGPVDQVLTRGDPLPPFDCHCPLMSLPLAFGTTVDSIPGETPYLDADPDAVAVWRQRLAALPGRRVGLAWAGNPDYADDRRRSIPPELLAPLGIIKGVSFVSLQKQDAVSSAGQTALPPVPLADWSGEFDDFADTAALIAALDLVIGVDTAVLHLAGALGRPAWLLNRFDPHFLWLQARDDSPWYPTLRQFRQTAPGDWPAVIARVAAALTDPQTWRAQAALC